MIALGSSKLKGAPSLGEARLIGRLRQLLTGPVWSVNSMPEYTLQVEPWHDSLISGVKPAFEKYRWKRVERPRVATTFCT